MHLFSVHTEVVSTLSHQPLHLLSGFLYNLLRIKMRDYKRMPMMLGTRYTALVAGGRMVYVTFPNS